MQRRSFLAGLAATVVGKAIGIKPEIPQANPFEGKAAHVAILDDLTPTGGWADPVASDPIGDMMAWVEKIKNSDPTYVPATYWDQHKVETTSV